MIPEYKTFLSTLTKHTLPHTDINYIRGGHETNVLNGGTRIKKIKILEVYTL